ncbi:MAG: hypothetical protein K9G49_14975 [Taibaiella sp.]|nr:hypothetical protein [Taibaiella sp.]
MKYLFSLLFLLPVLCSNGKDLCRKIIRTTDNTTGALTLKSPDLVNITVIKQFRQSDTFFALLLHFSDINPHFESSGARIVFEDGSELMDESVRVKCVQEQSLLVGGRMSGAASSGKYILQGFFRITDQHAASFMFKKIKRVELHTAFRLISTREAENVIGYVSCLR